MRVAIIPARGGSARIPRKNVRPFFGRPIIAYSIDAARLCALFDRIIVSTDDEEIARIARSNGAEVMMRSENLATAGTQDIGSLVVQRLCERDKAPRHACVIYATAPLMLPHDIVRGFQALEGELFSYAVHEKTGIDAGAFYWAEGWALLHNFPLGPRTVKVPMPDERVQDINVEIDWLECEQKYMRLHPECARS